MPVAELITIGNEILDGRVTDTNRVFLGRRLKELDFEIRYSQSVDDNEERVVAALSLAASRSDLIICTGGLGPTTDDLTAEAAAKFLNCPWLIHPQAESFLKNLFEKRQRVLHDSQLKQAKLPSLAVMIDNPVGTAPGFFYKGPWTGTAGAREIAIYFYPGIPREMQPMFEASVVKEYSQKSGTLKSYTWSTIFTSEGDLQEKLKQVEKTIAPFRIGFRTQIPENFVCLMGRAVTSEDEKKWDVALRDLKKILSPLSYNEGVERNFEELLLEKLISKKARVLFVESCTAGLVSHLLSEVPGSSASFWGSQVCYANEEKIRLGVKPETLKKFGAVSEECAREMALSGLERLKGDAFDGPLICVSTTGIAGPGGGSERKAVGLMYMALAYQRGNLDVPTVTLLAEKTQAPGFLERKTMKLYMAKRALDFLFRFSSSFD